MIVYSFVCLISLVMINASAFPVFSQPEAKYFAIEPKHEAISRIYTGMLDRDISSALQSFNPDDGLVQVQIPESVKAGHLEIRTLSDTERMQLANEPEYSWRFLQIQQTVNLAAALGYAYSFKQSQYYQSEESLQHLRAIFHTFAENQLDNGEFAFSSVRYGSVWGSYITAYQLEALMNAFAQVRNSLPAGERATYETMISKGIEFLSRNEPGYDDSRGMVWCGVMALASRFTGKQAYQNAAERKLKTILPVIFQHDGQILENGSPHLKDSLVSLQYLFLYRLMADDSALDTTILQSFQWIRQVYSFHAVPLLSMSSTKRYEEQIAVANLMGALTFYGQNHHTLNLTATTCLQTLILLQEGVTLQYGASHFLRGMQYHSKPESLGELPFQPYAQMYSSRDALYYTAGRNYQTAVTLRHTYGFKGMQAWSYKGQPPVVFPSSRHASEVKGFGFDSSRFDVDEPVRSNYVLTHLSNTLETLVYQQESLTSAYVFANDLMVVIYRDAFESGWVDWVMTKPQSAVMSTIENNAVVYEDTEARIFLPPVEPILTEEEPFNRLRFPYESGMIWFTLAGPESVAIVQPVIEGIVLIQINDQGNTINLVVNVSDESFRVDMNFPGTTIAVPQLEPFGASLISIPQYQ